MRSCRCLAHLGLHSGRGRDVVLDLLLLELLGAAARLPVRLLLLALLFLFLGRALCGGAARFALLLLPQGLLDD